jgi:Flp pilus assembly protein TadG
VGLIMRFANSLLGSRTAGFASDRRGIAATEFAMIAPALIFLVMGVLEMSFRFRASDEATRYVHQVADLISRENALEEDDLTEIYNAAPHMMMPLDSTDALDLDISSVGFVGDEVEPTMFWRRVAGQQVDFNLSETADMGAKDESVIRIGVRYRYESVLSSLFGGSAMSIERQAFSRPRMQRVVTLDGESDDGGAIQYFGN